MKEFSHVSSIRVKWVELHIDPSYTIERKISGYFLDEFSSSPHDDMLLYNIYINMAMACFEKIILFPSAWQNVTSKRIDGWETTQICASYQLYVCVCASGAASLLGQVVASQSNILDLPFAALIIILGAIIDQIQVVICEVYSNIRIWLDTMRLYSIEVPIETHLG